jgi:hypothetical protein
MKKYLFLSFIFLALSTFCAFGFEENNGKMIIAQSADTQATEQKDTNEKEGNIDDQKLSKEETEEIRKRAAEESARTVERLRFPESAYELRRKRTMPPQSINQMPAVGKTEVQPVPFQSEPTDYMKQKAPKKISSKGIVKTINDDYSLQLDDKKILKLENIYFNNEKQIEILNFMRSTLIGKKVTIHHSVERTGSYSYEMKRDKQGKFLIQDIKIQKEDLVKELINKQLASPIKE